MKQHLLVRQQRKLKNQSQKQVYTAIGMPQQTYSNKERGLHKFTRHELELIARHLGVDVSVFDEQPPATPASPLAALPEIIRDGLIAVTDQIVAVVVQDIIDKAKEGLLKELQIEEEKKKKKARKPTKRKKKR